jgi:hypothetical protein
MAYLSKQVRAALESLEPRRLLSGEVTPIPPLEPDPILAEAGGPYEVNEGWSGVAINPQVDQRAEKVEWDFDYDGTFDVGSPVHVTAITTMGRDGPSTFQVAVRVTLPSGEWAISVADVHVVNVAPTVNVYGAAESAPGEPYTLGLAATETVGHESFDRMKRWKVNWGDGSGWQVIQKGERTLSLTHTYANYRPYTIRVIAIDDDGQYEESKAINAMPHAPVPVAVVGGKDGRSRDGILTLRSRSFSEYSKIVSHEWDLDYDGVHFDVDLAGRSVDADVRYWGDSPYTNVGLRVTDADGLSVIRHNLAYVTGLEPPVELDGAKSVPAGATYRLAIDWRDPYHTPAKFRIDWGDGESEVVRPGKKWKGGSRFAVHRYEAAGAHRVRVKAMGDMSVPVITKRSVAVTPPFAALWGAVLAPTAFGGGVGSAIDDDLLLETLIGDVAFGGNPII